MLIIILLETMSAEAEAGDRLAECMAMEGDAARLARCGAGSDHQRDQMVFFRLRGARARRILPPDQRAVSNLGIDHAFTKPGVEGVSRGIIPTSGREPAHVVVALAASEDQDAILTKRPQGLPDGEVFGGTKVPLK
ncbi:MAG: hypothetical protein JO303_11420 [Caulobacteraceae bacterium]|nr:hypothetical protein [Caulobacteraceae bacterium]